MTEAVNNSATPSGLVRCLERVSESLSEYALDCVSQLLFSLAPLLLIDPIKNSQGLSRSRKAIGISVQAFAKLQQMRHGWAANDNVIFCDDVS
jgi:hypothetical protein